MVYAPGPASPLAALRVPQLPFARLGLWERCHQGNPRKMLADKGKEPTQCPCFRRQTAHTGTGRHVCSHCQHLCLWSSGCPGLGTAALDMQSSEGLGKEVGSSWTPRLRDRVSGFSGFDLLEQDAPEP